MGSVRIFSFLLLTGQHGVLTLRKKKNCRGVPVSPIGVRCNQMRVREMSKCKWRRVGEVDASRKPVYSPECLETPRAFSNAYWEDYKYCPYCGKEIEIEEGEGNET